MTLCMAPRHGEDEAETRPHSHLCEPCERGLRTDLRRLPRLHAELDHVPARGDGDGSGLPFSEPASECRALMRRNVVRTVKFIAEERSIPLPLDSFPVMCGWLIPQVGWCTFREEAPFLADAFRKTGARAMALLDPWIRKQFPLPDRCPECGPGILEVTIYASDGDNRTSTIACLNCPAYWNFGGDWLPFLALLKRLRKVAPDMEIVA